MGNAATTKKGDSTESGKFFLKMKQVYFFGIGLPIFNCEGMVY